MSWTELDIPDLTGRVAVVTGANGGLGLETARALARRGARIEMAVRDMAKAAAARNEILAEVPRAELRIRPLDLASLRSVHACADEILGDTGEIHLLVDNAGVMAIPRDVTEDGFERQLAVNHLGHFALTARLFPALVRAGDARVVTVTSGGRFIGGMVDPDDPHLERGYEPWRAYGRSKLANVQFALELQLRLADAGSDIRALSADPGFSDTNLQAHSARATGGVTQRLADALVDRIGASPARGALPQLRAATDPVAKGGSLYALRWLIAGAPVRFPIAGPHTGPEDLDLLWQISERETGVEFDVAGMVASERTA